jgi:hypothetical protein
VGHLKVPHRDFHVAVAPDGDPKPGIGHWIGG